MTTRLNPKIALPPYCARRDPSFVVVAVKKPEVAIFRFQAVTWQDYYHRQSPQTMVEELQKIVGCLDSTLEWTAFNYGSLPYYVSRRPFPATGIFRYDWIKPAHAQYGSRDCYESSGVRIGNVPKGWIHSDGD